MHFFTNNMKTHTNIPLKGSDPLDPTMYSSGADLKPFEIQTCRMHIEGLVLSRE